LGNNTARLGRFITGLLLAVLALPAVAADSYVDEFDVTATPIDDSPRLRDIHYPDWFKSSFLDLNTDLDEAIKSGKKGIIIYFGQKNCAYCEALMERDFGQKDIAEYTRHNFDVIALDIWGSREVTDLQGKELTEHDLSIREQTNFTPSLLFYDRDGKLALKMRGYYPPYKFRAALEYVVDGHYKKESYRDYLLRADPPPKFEIGDLNERAFFQKPPFALDRSHIPANRPLVVFFEQKECHACDVLHSDPLEDPGVLLLLSQMDAVQLDMWSDTPVITPSGQKMTAEEWANNLGIFYAPTLVFFDELGHEIFRVDSVVRLHRLHQVLDYVLTKAYQDTDYQTWARQQRAAAQQ
jgi:thioredoxin-related protein